MPSTQDERYDRVYIDWIVNSTLGMERLVTGGAPHVNKCPTSSHRSLVLLYHDFRCTPINRPWGGSPRCFVTLCELFQVSVR